MLYDIHLEPISQATILHNEFEKCTFRITTTSHGDLSVKLSLFAHPNPSTLSQSTISNAFP